MKTAKFIAKFLVLVFIGFSFSGCDPNLINSSKSGWESLAEFDGAITQIVSDKNGNVYVGGDFGYISVWNGNSWTKLPQPTFTTQVIRTPMSVDKNGDVYASFIYNNADGSSNYHIIKWNHVDNSWTDLTNNNPLFDSQINSMVSDTLGNIYVSGKVLYLSGTESGIYIYKWNGTNWTNIGGKIPAERTYLHVDKTGNLLASMSNMTSYSAIVAKWTGSGWEELGGTNVTNFGLGQINCINSDSKGNVFVGGYFVKGDSAFNLQKWNKNTNSWHSLHTFEDSSDANSIAFDSADTLYVGGKFKNSTKFNFVDKYHEGINRWNDYGILNANNTINTICFDKYGFLYAGGEFTNSNNKNYVALFKKQWLTKKQ